MLAETKLGIKHIGRTYDEAMDFMKKRASGEEKSIKTKWNTLNDALLEGIPWNSITVIGARPGTGKTLMSSLITRNAFALNPDQDFVVLDLQFEMLARNSAMRDLGQFTGKSMRHLNSCKRDGVMSSGDLTQAADYFKSRQELPIFIMEKPCTVESMTDIIPRFCEKPGIKGKRVIVTLDHTLLIKRDKSEASTVETLYNLGTSLSQMKRVLPVTFIVLSQLNQKVDGIDRTRIAMNHYPVMSDILGADAVTQSADSIIILNRPAKNQIREYGPDKYVINSEKVIAVHVVKGRDGGESMFWLKAEFEHMDIVDMPVSERPTSTTSYKK